MTTYSLNMSVQQSTRPLVLRRGGVEVTILIPLPLYPVAEQLREVFSAQSPSEAELAGQITKLELTCKFLDLARTRATQATPEGGDGFDFLPLVSVVTQHLESRFLHGNDIHAVVAGIPAASRPEVLRTYYLALATLKRHDLLSGVGFSKPQLASALFGAARAGRVKLLAVFGGQGNVEEYVEELVTLFRTYEGVVEPFIHQAALTLAHHSALPQAQDEHATKIDLMSWLEKPETRPGTEQLLSTHLSLPLIGVTQLACYYVTFKVLGVDPATMAQFFAAGTTGHSQGVVSAVAIASSQTEEEFFANAQKAIVLLFWLGLRAERACRKAVVDPNILQDSLANNEGVPTPMLAVQGIRHSELQKHVDSTNSFLPEDRRVHLSLVNGPRSAVFSGPPQSLYGLNNSLRKLKASGQDQTRVPYSERKVRFSSRFLPVAVPFHSGYLKDVPAQLEQDIIRHNLSFDAEKMAICVYNTHTGEDIRKRPDVTSSLVEQICLLPVYWEKATNAKGLTHVLDFGPGGASGVGFLTSRNKEGTGVQVVLAATIDDVPSEMLNKSSLFDQDPHSVKFAPNWSEQFRPRLIRMANTDQIHVETPFSRLLGKPPIMVPGMTPSTVQESFVAAVVNAGFHIELAGGGQHTEEYLRNRVKKIMNLVAPGEGITLNILFLNPRLWGFQYPAVKAMRKEGIPMEGVCVAAGVPSLDVANEVVSSLKEAGIRHVAFKPGGTETIRRVISIAKHNPDMPIVLQWTGGRGGGHHSFEDFHQPLLESYGAIRRQQNIILVVGSGFGDAKGTLPYLTGEWSVQFGYPPMPCDGLLVGSRVMVAAEARTSPGAKDLIVHAPGIADESLWEETYKREIGGIITVTSELGEPIHKIANRGIKFWRELDDTIFKLPRDKRLPALLAKKDYIIKRLNDDYQKPWFGRKGTQDGRPCDLHEMTYKEVAERMLELMWISHQSRWIDFTLRDTFVDFLRRIEERFVKKATLSLIQSSDDLNEEPKSLMEAVIDAFPEAAHQTLTQEDVFYFLAVCSYPWRKPVPFIPVIDEKFDFWFKRDSLWQSEDVDAVVGQDAQRVAILQGPVAVYHSKVANQPVKQILGDIYNEHIDELLRLYYGGSKANVPVVEYLGASLLRPAVGRHAGVSITPLEEGAIMFEVTRKSSELPDATEFLELLAGQKHNWLRAFLTTEAIVQGRLLVPNPARRILRPRPGQTVFIKYNTAGEPLLVTVYHMEDNKSPPRRNSSVVINKTDDVITLTLNEERKQKVVPLELFFRYQPRQGYNPIHEVMQGRNANIKRFYAALWSLDASCIDVSPFDTFTSTFKITPRNVSDFVQVIENHAEMYFDGDQQVAPMDFAISVAWSSLLQGVLCCDGDLLRLVHLSNQFRVLDAREVLRAGDEILTESVLNSVVITDAGKVVEVKATLKKQGVAIMEVTSSFLYRGKFTDYDKTFTRRTEQPVQVVCASRKDVEVLKSKPWLRWNADGSALAPGAGLIFRLETFAQNGSNKIFSKVNTKGTVWLKTTREVIEVARVDYEAADVHGNIVLEYMARNGSSIEQPVYFETGGYSVLPDKKVFPASVAVPLSNCAYADVSGDFNPIHTNAYFADLAGLPGTITHGMFTSASTRKFVEIFAANNDPRRVKSYRVTFLDMVLPGDELDTKLYHVGMSNGKKIIKVVTVNGRGSKVLEGEALVEQPGTAYVFTGQGSQEVGMGMELYEKSPVARELWDRAEAHMRSTYGISILKIVRVNPTSETVHFGGQNGDAIKRKYMSMTYEVMEMGEIKRIPLFPQINESTLSHTFTHTAGLLSATQFTQPALVLMEMASFIDMQANGLIQEDCSFAGHSLGEYAALGAVGQVLSIESLIDVVFYRGMTMQVAVPRDALGRSVYGMCAVNPSRMGRTFGQQALKLVVAAIRQHSNKLLEIVNYNVENLQYVVAGELSNLCALRVVLDDIKKLKIDFAELAKEKSIAEIESGLSDMVQGALQTVIRQVEEGGFPVQVRGEATMPLAGIDVPFHSSFLLNGVVPFRQMLCAKLDPKYINVRLLIGKYIPNLTAIPFDVSKEYAQLVYDLTHSEQLNQILRSWDDAAFSTAAGQQELGYLILIELLAHQFASPVRWIETQDVLFRDFRVERLIEVGPSPVLCTMAARTLKVKYEAFDDALTHRRVQLVTTKHKREIYYGFEDAPAESAADPADTAAPQPASAPAPAPATAVTTAASPRPATSVTDEPVRAKDILLVLVAHKLKKPLSEIAPSKSIKDLVGGKSTLQNEILGDLAAEFGNVLNDKAEELPLSDIAGALQESHSGSLGKVSNGHVNKMISSKMPAGFGMGQVKAYLSSMYGLGPQRASGALLYGLIQEPASRLASEGDAKTWLDAVAKSYAASVGIALGASAVEGQAGGASSAVVAINSEEFDKHKLRLDTMVREQLESSARYLGVDLIGNGRVSLEKDAVTALQEDLDEWLKEHGDKYGEGIRPQFTSQKARIFDSYWNWARQDALQLYYDMIFGKITKVDHELMNQCIHLMNRVDDAESLISFMEYYLENCEGENHVRTRSLGQILIDSCKEALSADPVYKNVAYRPMKPRTFVNENGELVYKEERRKAANMKEYVEEMCAGSELTKKTGSVGLESQVKELEALLENVKRMDAAIKSDVSRIFGDIKQLLSAQAAGETLPFIFLKARSAHDPSLWEPDMRLTTVYLDGLARIARDGLSFTGRQVLITGCGKGSIGVELLKALLSGGAQVIATTSRFSKSAMEFYRSIYERYGSKGSRLVVVPFNGGSVQDVKALVNYIYDTKEGLGWDIGYIIPFAAIPEQGREIDDVDSWSELAHRVMLINLLRLLGEVKRRKQVMQYDTRPAAVLLPMSPNHGVFGGDGLYGESKIGLETLVNRFHSENWSAYLTIIGAVIGWTRGTGLMSGNNIIAEGIEELGARTFSTHEMAFNLVGLLSPEIVKLSEVKPIIADLNGGLHLVGDLHRISTNLRAGLLETSEIRRAVAREAKLDSGVLNGPIKQEAVVVTPRANMKFKYPPLNKQKPSPLRGMLDLEKVVVVTGFGEVGPFGGARTRWEMEANGELSLEGCIEMAWMMGFIKFHSGPLKKLPSYSGWIDTRTQEPVKDFEVKAKYEEHILKHSGIRMIEPELFNGYDPERKMALQEILVTSDMSPVEVSKEDAEAVKRQHQDFAVVEQKDGQYTVRILKGATLWVPKALRFDRLVAGQIPTGWDAMRYGVPEDIANQVDPVTLYMLVSCVEALVNSGITDPYEFYQYCHVSEVGNTSGGGMGGMRAMQKIFKDRMMEKPVQGDILQESFINTMPAWINMLLLSASGPIKPVVAACATAAQSVEVGVETILSGKAKVVLCGGCDDFQEEGSFEFAKMRATSDSLLELAAGREPREMCRPAADTRAGFMEAQGAGNHVLMTAAMAIKMGLPIRGIVAHTSTAMDKLGRSVPAPGQGILTTARETPLKHGSPLLDLEYRSAQLRRERQRLKEWVADEYKDLAAQIDRMKNAGKEEVDSEFASERTAFIEKEAARREQAAKATWSHDWWKNDPSISPIRGALATYGLTIDDIGVASFHGTGTKANDFNESSVLNEQMTHLGRKTGNLLPAVFQKHLTGHPKGAAAAWMLNGVLQVLETGLIPGNRNLDNVDHELRDFKYILYPSHSIQTDGVRAGLLKSFGFGQAGAEVLVVHPDFLFAALEEDMFRDYVVRREKRQRQTYRYYHEMFTGQKPFVRVKSAAPYTPKQQNGVYLNLLARASYDKDAGSWSFANQEKTAKMTPADVTVTNALTEASKRLDVDTDGRGIGIDVQLCSEVPIDNETFVKRNFTEAEQAYCRQSADPLASFSGKWAAKEAVIKAVSSAAGRKVWTGGAGAPLKEIEIFRETGKAPVVRFHGAAEVAVKNLSIKSVKVAISHSGAYSVSVATVVSEGHSDATQ